ncbi:SM protein [Schistosoma haematobium]|nr:SM protein [Schistosoma haematobium]KAH9591598.1 SM protein [Schistosoma haematobium]
MAIIVRGGRVFIGFLRIIDQFGKISYPIYISVGNVVLHNAVERIHVAKKFCDVPQGILLIRGENITIIGELNPEINIDEKLERVSEEEIYKLQQEQTASRKELAKKRAELFAIRGLGFPDFLDIIDDT